MTKEQEAWRVMPSLKKPNVTMAAAGEKARPAETRDPSFSYSIPDASCSAVSVERCLECKVRRVACIDKRKR